MAPRTMLGDVIDARGRVRAEHAETPEWLLTSRDSFPSYSPRTVSSALRVAPSVSSRRYALAAGTR